jgi:hypothetical protein
MQRVESEPSGKCETCWEKDGEKKKESFFGSKSELSCLTFLGLSLSLLPNEFKRYFWDLREPPGKLKPNIHTLYGVLTIGTVHYTKALRGNH